MTRAAEQTDAPVGSYVYCIIASRKPLSLGPIGVGGRGDEVYTLRVRDLATGDDLPDEIPGTYYGVEWAMDDATLFYTVLNDAKRPWRLYRHALGTKKSDDVLVHQEDDEAF